MNQENYSSTLGAAVGVSGGSPIIPQDNGLAPGSDVDFQKLLLLLSCKAGERSDASALIEFFCRAVCDFFKVSGVYFWRCHSADELVGEQAYGKMSDRFTGLRMRADDSAVTA